MAGGKSWIRSALATVFSQWHFHLDLLDLWKNELASTSLALFVMGRPDDLATYQKMLAYYEHLITLFAFDTGYDPLVCIYDGEIRSTPWLYEFFSASPIYRDVSDRYYNSKLEDVNTQFTEQFLSNLALFWTVIIPDIFAHMAASAPLAIFESKANKLISLRKTTLANAGDFIKWMSHNYSLALKNYAPFVASPELWRAYNPFIDLYWWTLYGHILCLRAFKAIEASARIKPFIETQKAIISVNQQPYAEARLTGNGEISICIPNADLTGGDSEICFNSYNVISCLTNLVKCSFAHRWAAAGKWYPILTGDQQRIPWDMNTEYYSYATPGSTMYDLWVGYTIRTYGTVPMVCTVNLGNIVIGDLWARLQAVRFTRFSSRTVMEEVEISPNLTHTFYIPPKEVFAIEIHINGLKAKCAKPEITFNSVSVTADPVKDREYPEAWSRELYDEWTGITVGCILPGEE